MGKEVVLSGMRSTSNLHLGNYFGAAKNFVSMQKEYDCYFFIADYHALTTHLDTAQERLHKDARAVLVEYLACGIDPEQSAIYMQSDIPEIPELYLLLSMLAYKGELEKCVTFKEKVRAKNQSVNAGLLTYPVLMAADILIHRAHYVPVGKDQVQHLEMTRNFANRFNHITNSSFFPEPDAFNYGNELIKVPALDGGLKMSKSGDEKGTIFLSDSADTILKKVKKAKTDAGPTEKNQVKPQEVQNLFDLLKLVSNKDAIETFEDAYGNCTIRYGDLKMQLANDIIAFTEPIRSKISSIDSDDDYLRHVMETGKEKARESAQKTISGARELIGIQQF